MQLRHHRRGPPAIASTLYSVVVQQESQAVFMSHLATRLQWLPGRITLTHLGAPRVAPVPLRAGRCHGPIQRRKWWLPGTGLGWATCPLPFSDLPVQCGDAAVRHLSNNRFDARSGSCLLELTRLISDQIQSSPCRCDLPRGCCSRVGMHLDPRTDVRLPERSRRRLA